ncbi:unnamed protein product [Larinioides sclopetarius]|uniref:Uncharacterized protein n=1 Tax=Larinioides sclopetarius TaxID=280406 RepID=A0AAV2AK15_9ARAC
MGTHYARSIRTQRTISEHGQKYLFTPNVTALIPKFREGVMPSLLLPFQPQMQLLNSQREKRGKEKGDKTIRMMKDHTRLRILFHATPSMTSQPLPIPPLAAFPKRSTTSNVAPERAKKRTKEF